MDAPGLEADQADEDLAFATNRDGPAALADACAEIGAPLIHYSTDYVFDGTKTGAYVEGDPVNPLSVYGASKAEGDVAIRERLGIVDDQCGSPTAAADIAAATIAICTALAAGRDDGFGTFNFCGGGTTTWYGFAREIFKAAAERGLKTPRHVDPIATEAYPTPAPRPRNSMLDCGKVAQTYGVGAPSWQESLSACLDEVIATARQPLAAGGGS